MTYSNVSFVESGVFRNGSDILSNRNVREIIDRQQNINIDKGINPGGMGGCIPSHVLTWGDNMSFIPTPPPCFDPQICCFLFLKINNVL